MIYGLDRKPDGAVFDTVNGIVGLLLFIAPWALGFVASAAAAWNAWIVGALAVAVAVVALFQSARWLPWAYVVLGLWAIVAPWALGFAATTDAMYAHVIAGLVLAAVAAYEILRSGQGMHAA